VEASQPGLISSRVYMRLLRQAGSPKQTTGLAAINSIIQIYFLTNLKFALS
jgi:hypothetical protein